MDKHKWVLEKRNASLETGIDEDKEYSVTFAGIGYVAEEALKAIIHSDYSKFRFPIKNMYLVGRDLQESAARRSRIINELNVILHSENGKQNWPYKINFLSKSYEDMENEVLPNTDVLFVTADGNDKLTNGDKIKSRTNLTKNNTNVIENMGKYFNKDNFRGIANIVTNIPEVCAHVAATEWNLIDPRQITAHTPLDKNRANYILETLIAQALDSEDAHELRVLSSTGFENIDYFLVGHHENIQIVFSQAMINLGKFQTGLNESTLAFKMTDFLKEYLDVISIPSKIKQLVKDQVLLQQTECEGKLDKIPTIISTGSSIRDSLKAIINRTTTTIGLPYNIKKQIYFVDLPATMDKAYPLPDIEKMSRMTAKDKLNLENIIIGPYSDPEDEAKPLKQILEMTIKNPKKILLPKSTKKIDAIFSPANKTINKKTTVTEVKLAPQGFLKKFAGINSYTQESMKKEIEDNLKTDIYLSSTIIDRTITRYSFKNSLNPGTKDITLSINEKELTKARIEKEKIDLLCFTVKNNYLYALSYRYHKSRPAEHTLHSFNLGLGGLEKLGKKKIIGSTKEFEIKGFEVANNNVFILTEDEQESVINTYDFNSGYLKRIYANKNISSIFRTNEKIGFTTPEGIYLLNKTKPKQLHKSVATPNSIFKTTNNNELIFYYTDNQDSVMVVDLKSGATKAIETKYNSFDFTQTKKGGIELATLNPDGITISRFDSIKDLFNKEPKEYRLENKNLVNSTIMTPREHILFALNETDDFSIIYHNKGNMYLEKINKINNFTDLGGLYISK